MTHTVKHLSTHAAPGARSQPIAFLGTTMWVGSWDTKRLYGIDPTDWTVHTQVELPGIPYGIASLDGELHLVISIGEDDDRYLYRFVPGTPFAQEGRIPCPELTGSHLTSDGHSLYLVQQGFRRMLELSADGTQKRHIPFPTRCAGAGFNGGAFTMIAADADFDVLELATFDIDTPGAEPVKLAPMHVEARGLAFDGARWWTSYRELNEIVSFSM